MVLTKWFFILPRLHVKTDLIKAIKFMSYNKTLKYMNHYEYLTQLFVTFKN